MKKINIVGSNNEFNEIINIGKVYKNRYYAIYVVNKKSIYYRFGIAVSKKIGNAVVRNKIKRQIKDIIDKSNIKYEFYDCIILTRNAILNLNFQEREKYLIELLVIINKEKCNE